MELKTNGEQGIVGRDIGGANYHVDVGGTGTVIEVWSGDGLKLLQPAGGWQDSP